MSLLIFAVLAKLLRNGQQSNFLVCSSLLSLFVSMMCSSAPGWKLLYFPLTSDTSGQ